ncbi:cytochrome c oxidase subunit II [Halorarius litoreus]|uniref:cytochrome c oxidase subunit II n=1 Tax=Halorarius litoreus TaxID=2962676 RepID=UPI0020CC02AE|nr:cytochrome c oxidase subunit II [Halorarius litoreus]
MTGTLNLARLPVSLQGGGIVPRGSRVEVFSQIFDVFLVLGTLVGVIVIGYMVYNAYIYRDTGDGDDYDDDRPELGEIPTGGGKGGKLFLSFGLSAIVVVSLIGWTFGTLLYVEAAEPVESDDAITVEVEGFQFGWSFTYPNGHQASTLRLPADTPVKLEVTSRDVFHNFGIPELRVKTDAIPGQTTETWLITDEPAEYKAICYELCGTGHSFMQANVVVMEQQAYEEWYAGTTNSSENASRVTAPAALEAEP